MLNFKPPPCPPQTPEATLRKTCSQKTYTNRLLKHGSNPQCKVCRPLFRPIPSGKQHKSLIIGSPILSHSAGCANLMLAVKFSLGSPIVRRGFLCSFVGL